MGLLVGAAVIAGLMAVVVAVIKYDLYQKQKADAKAREKSASAAGEGRAASMIIVTAPQFYSPPEASVAEARGAIEFPDADRSEFSSERD